MRPALLAEPPRGRFTFVVGKGGVGKSTTAAALALNWAAQGHDIHLISTDPAPSITDIFRAEGPYPRRSVCNERLVLEELDAKAITDAWMTRMRAPLEQLVEQGTYLDGADVARLTHLTLPGVDELGAALRVAELSRQHATHIVVDTAPTGHTLRLLDSAALIDSWANVFFAMADKVATIAFTMVNARVRLAGEDAIDEMRNTSSAFRDALRDARFVVVTRSGTVVSAETQRLVAALHERQLQVSAVVHVSGDASVGNAGDAHETPFISGDVPIAAIYVPRLRDAGGCDGLQEWAAAAKSVGAPPSVTTTSASSRSVTSRSVTSVSASSRSGPANPVHDDAKLPARAWLRSRTERLLWFAGKGGVGKSTCAAAAAAALADTRDVLLCSTDPAGSLREVLQLAVPADGQIVRPRLRALQIDAAAQLEEWRAKYRAEADAIFAQIAGGSATLDRNIMAAIWDAVPPGIDELFALAEILDAAETNETIVIDAAPTGHFLRLVQSPELALEWTHAILRILLKYGVAGSLEGFSERILAFAKQLKHLRAVMTDATACAVFLVTIDEGVVQAQTNRLSRQLERIGIPVAATILNRAEADATQFPAALQTSSVRLTAPYRTQQPVGIEQLDAFIDTWRTA